MSNQLPMAINPPIPFEQCNFELIELPPEYRIHAYCLDFVIETNHKLIDPSVVYLLGISHEWCTTYIGGEDKYTKCQISQGFDKGSYGRYGTMSGITLEQLNIIWAKAKNNRADKYKPTLSELILTQVLPLFNAQPQIKHDDFKKEIDMNTLTSNQPLTMSSLDIAEMCEKQHRNVMADIKTMLEQLEISSAEFSAQYKDKSGKMNPCFNLNKEMSLTLVAGYNVKLRHKIIKRWQELENQVTAPALPTNYKEALLALVQKVDETERLTAENEHLNKTKMQISSKREASAMGKLARANDKIKQLQMVAKLETNLADKVSQFSHATVLAIQSRVDNFKPNGLKLGNYCRKHGLEIQNIPEPRFGVVHSYPAEAWQNVYNVNINSILGA